MDLLIGMSEINFIYMGENHMPEKKQKRNNPLLNTVILLFVILVAWYWLAPMLGITVGISANGFALLVTLLVLMGVGSILVPILAGVGIILLFVAIFVFGILAVVLFPILLPFLIPIFIIFLVVYLIIRFFN